MNQLTKGVLHGNTPFFLAVIVLIATMFPVSCYGTVSATGNTVSSLSEQAVGGKKVVIKADQLIYYESQQQLSASGNVQVWYQGMTLTADQAEADLVTQMLQASGNVTLSESDRDIRSVKLDYNLKTKSAKASGILFASDPWYYQGTTVEKIGENQVIISEPKFSTCNARHPHYHLKARTIEITLGEALTAHDVTLYVGNTPVFYLPWFRRSLDDSRPPFSIELGYNDFEGMFAKMSYNYFFSKNNYGGLLLNLMEKKGIGTGLDHYLNYQAWGSGKSEVHFLYILDPNAEQENITANFVNHHQFTAKDELKINLDYLSNRDFNREFSSALVDTYQQRSTIYYSHRDSSYNFTLGLQENLVFDPLREKYYPGTRELPSASFTMFSREVARLVFPVYFGLNTTARRTFPRIITAAPDPSDWDNVYFRYFNQFASTPSFRQTYVFPISVVTQPSLSWSLSTPLTGSYKEKLIDGYEPDNNGRPGELTAGYRTAVTVTNKWVNYRYTKPTHLLESNLTHEFSRQFELLQEPSLAHAGITAHLLRLRLDYDMGNFFHSDISSSYNFLTAENKQNWYTPIANPQFNGRWTLGNKFYLTWQGTYQWEIGQVSSANLGLNHNSPFWNASVYANYNTLINRELSSQAILGIDESVLLSINAGVRPPNWNLSLRGSIQLDAMTGEYTNLSVGVTRDVHCWSVQGGFKLYQDGNIQFGLGMNIKAFPDIKTGFGGY